MDGQTGSVDVVVVSHNSEAVLEQAIRSARAWNRTAKVVVVDNGSIDGSVAVAGSLADEVVTTSNIGFGRGQNLGIARSQREWVLLLNPDAVVDAAALESGYLYATGNDDVAMVEGSIRRSADGEFERWCGSEPGLAALISRLLHLRERLGERRLMSLARLVGRTDYANRSVREPVSVEFLAAVAPLVRRAAFEGVGGFDERIFLYAEDIDLCRRLRAAGWKVVALPGAWADHTGGASSVGREARRSVLWWQSHRTFVHKHWTGWRRLIGRAVTTLGVHAEGRRAP